MNQNYTFFLSNRQKIHTCVPVFFHGDDIVISHLFICIFNYCLMTFYGIDELVGEVYRLDSQGRELHLNPGSTAGLCVILNGP